MFMRRKVCSERPIDQPLADSQAANDRGACRVAAVIDPNARIVTDRTLPFGKELDAQHRQGR
jgi:hypothetical protein